MSSEKFLASVGSVWHISSGSESAQAGTTVCKRIFARLSAYTVAVRKWVMVLNGDQSIVSWH